MTCPIFWHRFRFPFVRPLFRAFAAIACPLFRSPPHLIVSLSHLSLAALIIRYDFGLFEAGLMQHRSIQSLCARIPILLRFGSCQDSSVAQPSPPPFVRLGCGFLPTRLSHHAEIPSYLCRVLGDCPTYEDPLLPCSVVRTSTVSAILVSVRPLSSTPPHCPQTTGTSAESPQTAGSDGAIPTGAT